MNHWFTTSAILLSYTTSTGWGDEPGWSSSTARAAIRGRYNPGHGHEGLIQDRPTLIVIPKFYCSATESITENNRLKYSGVVYNVSFAKNTMKMNHHLTVYLERPA